jgi:aryl-alcohol dehydrogenase-like predicted oxidoreductase
VGRRFAAAAAFTFQQILYSLINREAEFELFPVAEDQGMGSMIWGPLAARVPVGTSATRRAPTVRGSPGCRRCPVPDWVAPRP